MLIESLVILGGCIAYMFLNNGESTQKEPDHPTIELSKEEKTLEYFNNLTLQEQREYMAYNLDLKDYQDMLTDNRYFNAKHVANISRKLNKEFTNKNKRY